MNLIGRGMVTLSSADGATAQVKRMSGRVTPDVEVFQPQGVHFRLPTNAEGAMVSPAGVADNAVLVGASDRRNLPSESIELGEGGLHYLGTYKVFLNADGTVCLGDKEATDFVALASLVDARITAIVTALNTHTHAVAGAAASANPLAIAVQAPTAATQTKAS